MVFFYQSPLYNKFCLSTKAVARALFPDPSPIPVVCTSLIPSPALKMAQLDPLSADPADLAVAITLPTCLGTQQGCAVLQIGATGAGQNSGHPWRDGYPLHHWRWPRCCRC